MNDKITTLRIHQSTKLKLESLGNYGDSHEDIIKRLLQMYEENVLIQ